MVVTSLCITNTDTTFSPETYSYLLIHSNDPETGGWLWNPGHTSQIPLPMSYNLPGNRVGIQFLATELVDPLTPGLFLCGIEGSTEDNICLHMEFPLGRESSWKQWPSKIGTDPMFSGSMVEIEPNKFLAIASEAKTTYLFENGVWTDSPPAMPIQIRNNFLVAVDTDRVLSIAGYDSYTGGYFVANACFILSLSENRWTAAPFCPGPGAFEVFQWDVQVEGARSRFAINNEHFGPIQDFYVLNMETLAWTLKNAAPWSPPTWICCGASIIIEPFVSAARQSDQPLHIKFFSSRETWYQLVNKQTDFVYSDSGPPQWSFTYNTFNQTQFTRVVFRVAH